MRRFLLLPAHLRMETGEGRMAMQSARILPQFFTKGIHVVALIHPILTSALSNIRFQ
jgi:hypothetical protein